MVADVAIIGGTGVGDVLAQLGGASIHIPTPEGQVSGKVLDHTSGPLLLVSRHSAGPKVPPHKVNYKAIALGAKKAGVRFCFSTAAVGSLRTDWPTGTMAAISDFLDLTGRRLTMFDNVVQHTDFSEPLSYKGRESVMRAAHDLGLSIQPSGVYICENGPRYETPHEIELLAKKGDVVGMTAASEAILMHEIGIEYACLALVTNLAAGLTGSGPSGDKAKNRSEDWVSTPIGNTTPCAKLSHEEVVAEMQKNSKTVVQLLLKAADIARETP